MKLSKLYCNKPEVFGPIDFVPGLNVVEAEIRLPENKNKDTHNLGKTTLGRMLDFGFLAARDPKFFLFKHEDLFREFVFFLEIELNDASYLTVRRRVEEASKISFKKHEARYQDFSTMGDAGWDHFDLPFDRAREMLDAYSIGARSNRGITGENLATYFATKTTIVTFSSSISFCRATPTGNHFSPMSSASTRNTSSGITRKGRNSKKSRPLFRRS